MRTARRLLVVAGILAAGLALAPAAPAAAHTLDGAGPSNYRTRITAIEPALPGVAMRAVEAGNRLELTNRGDAEIVVVGYAREPYLRIGPDGVFENLRSPATYLNAERFPTGELPAGADPEAEPDWHRVSSGSTWRWHDHRAHWMNDNDPPRVREAPRETHVIFPAFSIPLRVGGVDGFEAAATGDLTWVPGPSPLPWLALAAVAAGALAWLGGPRRQAVGALFGATLVVLVFADVARLASMAAESDRSFVSALGASLVAVGSWVAAALAVWRLAVRDTATAEPLVALAGLLFAFGAALDLGVLSSSQLPSAGPDWAARLGVTAVLGLGLGLTIAAAHRLIAPPRPPVATADPGGVGAAP